MATVPVFSPLPKFAPPPRNFFRPLRSYRPLGFFSCALASGLRSPSSTFYHAPRYSKLSRLSPNPRISSSFFKPRCFRCGLQGHLARSCSAVRCFQCGDFGHKRSYCRNPIKEQSKRCLSTAFAKGEGDELGSFRSSVIEPHLPVDCLFFDPDVASCLGKGPLVRDLVPPAGTEGHHLELAEMSEEDSKEIVQICEIPKASSFSVHIFSLRKFSGKDYGRVISGKFFQRLGSRSLLGKRRLSVASFGSKQPAKLWTLFGKVGFLPRILVSMPILPNKLQQLNECPPVSLADPISVDLDKSPEIDLPPAPFDVISSFAIIDDFEDVFSDVNEGSEHHFSSGKDCSDDISSFQPRIVKDVAAKSLKWSPKIVPPVSIRRSPRLNLVLSS